MSRKSLSSLMLLALLMPALGQAAFAQTAQVTGRITDSGSAVIQGAQLTVTNMDTGVGKRGVSNEEGYYTVSALPPGKYRITAQAPGFKPVRHEGITLSVEQAARFDFIMEIGDVTEEVQVSGDAPLVDTRQAQLSGLVDAQRVNDLPLNGRNVYDLVSILPGVGQTRLPAVQNNDGNFLNVNGSRTRQSTFMLDGGFNNDLWRNSGNAAPNPDAVHEFRLITSNFNAEHGRSPGGVINVVTKSGTNEWHGTGFEFLRNDKLNARDFSRRTVDPLRQNQFGGSLGGPIVRDKAFFFTSYEGLRVRSNAFRNNAFTPTEAERRGDFSASAQQPKDPLTGKPFPGGIIPTERLDLVAMSILEKMVPLPNASRIPGGPLDVLEVEEPTKSNFDQALVKLDYELTPRHKLYGTLFVVNGNTFDPFAGVSSIPNYSPLDNTLKQRNIVVNEDWALSPSALNQARFTFTRRTAVSVGDIRTSWKDFGSQVTLGAEPSRPPQIFITGRWDMGHFGEGTIANESIGFSDTLTWDRGAHSFKVGTWFLYNKYDEPGSWLGSGQVRFNGGVTGNALADFMLGRASSFRQNNGTDRHFRSKNWHSFFQDDWKLHPRITLNLGLRYELNTPWVSPTDEFQTFRFDQQSTVFPTAPLGLQFPGDPGISSGLVETDRNNLAPRFGIAIDPFGDGKTAIRAGYGVFYAIGFANFSSDMQGQPFLVDTTVFGTPNLINPYANVPGGSPFPYTLDPANPRFSLPVTASYMSENYATPYVQHYSLTIERQLMRELSLQVAYVGNTSRKLVVQRDANSPVFIPGASSGSNINARRPYLPGTFAQIPHTETASNAHYNSLQVTVNRRFKGGFTLLTNYTLSKSIDEISDDKFNPTAVALVDSNDRRRDRAVSSFDIRHIFVVSYLWEAPQFKSLGWLGRHVLGGWQLNGITRFQSGNPFNVVSGSDTNFDGNNNDRPDLAGDPQLSANRSRDELIAGYFNTAAFAKVPDNSGSAGNAGRNLIYGPGLSVSNVSFFKHIPITERYRFQFRAEFFNFFNQVNLSNPVATLSSKDFGKIISSDKARIAQLGLKFFF